VRSSLSVTATASARCVSGKVVLTTVVRNDSTSTIDVATTSDFGSKTVTGVAPGANATVATTTRAVSVAAGSVSVTATVPGTTVSTQKNATYAARSCR
jgi:hypothetical protein